MSGGNCSHCLRELEDRLGYSSPADAALCGPCYFALWGPRNGSTLSVPSERRRPWSRRPLRRKAAWVVPGPSGELGRPNRLLNRLRRRQR